MAAGLYDITTETLGKGHFAVVKLAKHCLTGESVAIKIIDKVKLSKESLHQLGIEIRLWSRLSEHEHPNVVKLYQVIDTRSKLYLVMEYCGDDVCDLFDYLQRKNNGSGLKESDARHVFRQICSAISYCHSLRIVHRDLKPENILIIAQPQEQQIHLRVKYPLVKLIDFGFSNQWAEGEMLRTSCGSLAYSAPEILLGDHYDGPKVDIWGLGCILYILLYGNNPFMQINDSETLCRILDCNFSTPSRPSICESAIELIKALLIRDPTSRLSIQEVLKHPWLTILDEEYNNADYGTSFDNIHKSPFVPKPMTERKNSLHDKIIEHMLADKSINQMVTSKDHIEKALDRARSDSAGSGSGGSRTASPNPLTLKPQHSQTQQQQPQTNTTSTTITTATATATTVTTTTTSTTSSSSPNEHYIKATYHLLKDKLLRESHMKDSNSSSQSHKRILPLKQFPRKNYLQQQRQKAAKDAIQEDETENDSNLPNKLKKEQEKQQVHSLDLLNEEEAGVVLPLARKCSIVSEEGSCAADGTASDGTGSECGMNGPVFGDGTSNYSNGSNSSEHIKNRPIVNIIVTDCSEIEEAEDEVMRISEECLVYPDEDDGYQRSDESGESHGEDEELDHEREITSRDLNSSSAYTPYSHVTSVTTGTGHYIKKGSALSKLSHPHITLHTVSSSPELLRSIDQDDNGGSDDGSDYDHYNPSSHTGGLSMIPIRKRTMVLSNEMETCKDDESFTHPSSHHIVHAHPLPNSSLSQTTTHSSGDHNSSISSSQAQTNVLEAHIPLAVTSMRIITSSKSCNNILFNNGKNSKQQEDDGGDCSKTMTGDDNGNDDRGHCQGDASQTTSTAYNSQLVKSSSGHEIAKKNPHSKTERNDCCLIS